MRQRDVSGLIDLEVYRLKLTLAVEMVSLVCSHLLFFLPLMENFKVGTLNLNGAREAKKWSMLLR